MEVQPKTLNELITFTLQQQTKWHFVLLFAINLISSIVGINHVLTSFHTYTPDFYCRVSSELSFFIKFGVPQSITLETIWFMLFINGLFLLEY